MYYDKQPEKKKEEYKHMLEIVGSLSRLFSNAKSPFLHYRAHENIFAKYFGVENNARSDDSADAYDREKGIGIGLKTWVGQDNQKVAEFGRLRPEYESLTGKELVVRISEYRNARIRATMNAHGLQEMLYHIVKRVPGAMQIYEATFDYIDISKIKLDKKRGTENSIYFSDGKHIYNFNLAKHTLYMIFDDMELLDRLDVSIYEDPYNMLSKVLSEDGLGYQKEVPGYDEILQDKILAEGPPKSQLCLRLYSTKRDGSKFVAEKSGLNQWNAAGRKRDLDELYIPYPAKDRNRKSFFPPRDTPFDLRLPNGTEISAKVCQQDSKAIMSNPNKVLGKWLLRDVLELEEGTQITYSMLKKFNIDSVMFTKEAEGKYSVDFCELGTYEKFYGEEDIDAEYDIEDESEL